MRKRIKPPIDILLLCTLLISFGSDKLLSGLDGIVWWIVHISFGIAFIVWVVIHLSVNGRGWFNAGKKFLRDEKYKSIRGRYTVDWFLLIIWAVVSLSSFPAIGYKFGVDGTFMLTKAFHSGFFTLGILLFIVHILQHKKQIAAYFNKRKNKHNNFTDE